MKFVALITFIGVTTVLLCNTVTADDAIPIKKTHSRTGKTTKAEASTTTVSAKALLKSRIPSKKPVAGILYAPTVAAPIDVSISEQQFTTGFPQKHIPAATSTSGPPTESGLSSTTQTSPTVKVTTPTVFNFKLNPSPHPSKASNIASGYKAASTTVAAKSVPNRKNVRYDKSAKVATTTTTESHSSTKSSSGYKNLRGRGAYKFRLPSSIEAFNTEEEYIPKKSVKRQ